MIGLVRAWLREDILYREAVAMGLDQDDHIIRRRLAQKLEFLTNDIAQMQEPSDAELQAYFDQNIDRFKSPDRVTFTHLYFNPDTRVVTRRSTTRRRPSCACRKPANRTVEIVDEGDRFMLQNLFRGGF